MGSGHWKGQIGDVRCYNRALTDQEIHRLYDATRTQFYSKWDWWLFVLRDTWRWLVKGVPKRKRFSPQQVEEVKRALAELERLLALLDEE